MIDVIKSLRLVDGEGKSNETMVGFGASGFRARVHRDGAIAGAAAPAWAVLVSRFTSRFTCSSGYAGLERILGDWW